MCNKFMTRKPNQKMDSFQTCPSAGRHLAGTRIGNTSKSSVFLEPVSEYIGTECTMPQKYVRINLPSAASAGPRQGASGRGGGMFLSARPPGACGHSSVPGLLREAQSTSVARGRGARGGRASAPLWLPSLTLHGETDGPEGQVQLPPDPAGNTRSATSSRRGSWTAAPPASLQRSLLGKGAHQRGLRGRRVCEGQCYVSTHAATAAQKVQGQPAGGWRYFLWGCC